MAAKKIRPCVGKVLPLTEGVEATKAVHEGRTKGQDGFDSSRYCCLMLIIR
jgi:hypothetical protein